MPTNTQNDSIGRANLSALRRSDFFLAEMILVLSSPTRSPHRVDHPVAVRSCTVRAARHVQKLGLLELNSFCKEILVSRMQRERGEGLLQEAQMIENDSIVLVPLYLFFLISI